MFEWKRRGGRRGDAEGGLLEGSVDKRKGNSVERGRVQLVRRHGRRRAGMLDRSTEGTLLERAVEQRIGGSAAQCR